LYVESGPRVDSKRRGIGGPRFFANEIERLVAAGEHLKEDAGTAAPDGYNRRREDTVVQGAA
jgi:hypothetical protein